MNENIVLINVYSFFVDEGRVLQTVDMSQSLIPSTQNWFRAYNMPITDEYLNWCVYGNNTETRALSEEDNCINIKQIVLSSGLRTIFPGIE